MNERIYTHQSENIKAFFNVTAPKFGSDSYIEPYIQNQKEKKVSLILFSSSSVVMIHT